MDLRPPQPDACGAGLDAPRPGSRGCWAGLAACRDQAVGQVSRSRLPSPWCFAVARHPVRSLRRHLPHGVLLPDVAAASSSASGCSPTTAGPPRPTGLRGRPAAGLEADFEAERTDTGLRLITRRERHSHNSWTHNASPSSAATAATNRLTSPRRTPTPPACDGNQPGALEGGRGRGGGAVTDDLMPGVVSLPRVGPRRRQRAHRRPRPRRRERQRAHRRRPRRHRAPVGHGPHDRSLAVEVEPA